MVVGEFTLEADVVIIGGGPGGYAAAIRAADVGLHPVLVDARPELGGTWLHDGCLLSKELTHLAGTIRAAARIQSIGVEFGRPRIDMPKLRAAITFAADRTSLDLRRQCETAGVRVVRGEARFENSRQLSIVGNADVPRIRFRRAIIATGSRMRIPEALRVHDARVLTPSTALGLDVVPESLLVVGGSSAALELGGAFAALGSRVTVADERPEFLPIVDRDLAETVLSHLAEAPLQLYPAVSVTRLEPEKKGIRASFEGRGAPRESVYQTVLLAVGREPNSAALELGRTSAQVDSAGFIEVDSSLRTTEPRILAVGDATGEPMLVLKAVQQGRVAAEVAAGWSSGFDARALPNVLYIDPPLAWCGVTEAEAKAAEVEHCIHRTRWIASARSGSPAQADGWTKVIYDPDTKLVLGVGIFGPGAAEMIAEAVLAIEMGAELSDLAAIVHAHPSLGDQLSVAAREAEIAQSEGQ